ncbi:hypothetical protein MPER_12070 [Moniliophthora perniciosa FA553]|nr:hypothetical protein MPER_12070 [Moniliophthora perniciosa FA553]
MKKLTLTWSGKIWFTENKLGGFEIKVSTLKVSLNVSLHRQLLTAFRRREQNFDTQLEQQNFCTQGTKASGEGKNRNFDAQGESQNFIPPAAKLGMRGTEAFGEDQNRNFDAQDEGNNFNTYMERHNLERTRVEISMLKLLTASKRKERNFVAQDEQ